MNDTSQPKSVTKAAPFLIIVCGHRAGFESFREHSLPLIGVGDWNDGMSRVGAKGRGESVWLGWFLYEVLNLFANLCRKRNDSKRADRFQKVSENLASSLNEHAWDGQWYRRAFTDSGQWIGSIYNEECRIDAIAQSWSVISGAAPVEKAWQAMLSFDRELVDRDLSVVRLLTPPFEHTDPSPGYIQGYPPGIRKTGLSTPMQPYGVLSPGACLETGKKLSSYLICLTR